MRIPSYTTVGGTFSDTSQLRNALTALEIVNPKTNEPFTEAMLLGIGGGLHFTYFIFEYEATATLVLHGRYEDIKQGALFAELVCSRLGIPATRKETSGVKAAQRHLREALEQKRPALIWVDQAALPYHNLPVELERTFYHAITACGFEDSDVLIDDLAPEPWRMDWEELNEARNAIQYVNNRLLSIGRPEGSLRVRNGIVLGLKQCVANLSDQEVSNFGLEGIQHWESLLYDTDEKSRWNKIFNSPKRQYNALRDLYKCIRLGGNKGGSGLLRGMFADFLMEAAPILEEPELENIATKYRRLEFSWNTLADTALPDAMGYLSKTRNLLDEQHKLLSENGGEAMERLREISDELWNMEIDADEHVANDGPLFAHLFNDIRDQLKSLYLQERSALEDLHEVVRGLRA